MVGHKLRLIVLDSVLALGLAACRHGDTAHHTDALIVCPGAEAVNWGQFQGTDQLAYQVKVEYPAVRLGFG
jgi:hypothetical protein